MVANATSIVHLAFLSITCRSLGKGRPVRDNSKCDSFLHGHQFRPAPANVERGYRRTGNALIVASTSWEEAIGPGGCFLNGAVGEIIARGSKFPGTWDEVFDQACTATMSAMERGVKRMLVELRQKEEIGIGDRGQLIVKRGGAETPSARSQLNNLKIAMGMCNALIECYLEGGIGKRIKVYFNTDEQGAKAQTMLKPYKRDSVVIDVLRNGTKNHLWEDISILVTPTNQSGNPSRIEAVEMIHYHRSWKGDVKPVVLLNPDLVALTSSKLESTERIPMFMADYVPCYYINPGAFLSESVTGAVLKCFPRNWEMYELRRYQRRGFRIIGERTKRPTCEDLLSAFAW